jgi:UMF1 family MFS transporter
VDAPGAASPTRLATWSWIGYDLANTIFALGVIGLYFPAWLTSRGLADSSLSVVEAAAGILVVFLAPWIGARTDALGRRVPALVATTAVAVGATAVLGRGPEWLSLLALGVALVAFNTGSVVYDALLPVVSTPATRGRVSGLGVGVGYVGSFIGLGIGTVALEVLELTYPATFTLLAIGVVLFAWPAFVFIAEPARPPKPAPGPGEVLVRLLRSWQRAATFPGMVRFLVGRFLYTDAINTLIGGFLAIYAIQELGLEPAQTTVLLAVAIAAAIPGSFFAGWAVSRFGALRVLRATLVAWIVALAAGVAAGTDGVSALAWVIGPLGGAALGATWTSDRVVMTDISPPEHLGEMYGLYATVGRFATILGPLVWALVVDVLGLPRTVALGTLGVFVFAGFLVLGGLRRAVTDAGLRRG